MTDKLTVAGFRDFVNAQPDDRPILHHYESHGHDAFSAPSAWGAWSPCAIGDYVESVTGHRDGNECSRFANGPLDEAEREIAEALNKGKPATYGELAAMF